MHVACCPSLYRPSRRVCAAGRVAHLRCAIGPSFSQLAAARSGETEFDCKAAIPLNQEYSRCDESPSPPFRGEREGPVAKRWEGDVGGTAVLHVVPPHPPPSPRPAGGEGEETVAAKLRRQTFAKVVRR